MATGTVRWFSHTRGYGFIEPDGGGNDLFVHFSNIRDGRYKQLDEGSRVEYETKRGSKGAEATDVNPVG